MPHLDLLSLYYHIFISELSGDFFDDSYLYFLNYVPLLFFSAADEETDLDL
jgi:hypothetical protein